MKRIVWLIFILLSVTVSIMAQMENRERISADLYVSPNGNNSNSGLSFAEPLQTIQYACTIIEATESDPHTIYLAEGTYSPSVNGESFPILLPQYVSLVGVSENTSIIDAEYTESVLRLESCDNVVVSDLTLSHGYAVSGNWYNCCGGGLNLYASDCTVTRVTIAENTAQNGGGLSIEGSDPDLTDLKIINNTAIENGGGLFNTVSHPIYFKRSLFAGNTAECGGAVYFFEDSPYLINCTIADNSAIEGGAFWSEDTSPVYFNTIVWGNEPEQIWIDCGMYPYANMFLAYSILEGGIDAIHNSLGPIFWLEGNLDCDPLFVDPENGDYRLQDNSPCINAGISSYWYSNNLNFTLNEEDYISCAPDMGAFEYEDTSLYARFRAETRIGCSPLEVEFIDISSGETTGWTWDFDNDQQIDSDEQNPVWTFYDTGEYTVTLTVTDAAGATAATTKDDFISLLPSRVHNIEQDTWFNTIQKAIYSADTNDTLVLEPGIYYEQVEIIQKSVNLASQYLLTGDESFIESTIIDGESSKIGVFVYLSSINTVGLSGFTVRNCSSYGGGIFTYEGNLLIDHLNIMDNSANYGAGIRLNDTNLDISYSVFANNEAEYGAGILASGNSYLNIQNCTIADNFASEEGCAIYCTQHIDLLLINSILRNDPSNEIYYYGQSSSDWFISAYSNIYGNIESLDFSGTAILHWLDGNMDVDPLFEDAAGGNYHLSGDSPCIDAGTAYYCLGTIELINLNDDQYINIAPDMGAYEYDNAGVIEYGDIDNNSVVESYDASLLLMYLVGFDPIPADPAPWEEWRVTRADVDLDGNLTAYDGALILQYVVGIIEELPVRSRMISGKNMISISNDDECIYLFSEKDVFSLSYQIIKTENLVIKEAEIMLQNCLFSKNGDRLALASAEAITGRIIRLPFEKTGDRCSVTLNLECNGNSGTISYQFPDSAPAVTRLQSVYPNPFNPQTTISYQLAEGGKVELEIYNIRGQKVGEISDENQAAGIHSVVWKPEKLSSGIYYIRFHADEYQEIVKTLLLK